MTDHDGCVGCKYEVFSKFEMPCFSCRRSYIDRFALKENDPKKYKTKPCEIEAVQWDGFNLKEISEFVGESSVNYISTAAWQTIDKRTGIRMRIKTLEGWLDVSVGDYIIKGLAGEFYPCKPDVFEKKYELI